MSGAASPLLRASAATVIGRLVVELSWLWPLIAGWAVVVVPIAGALAAAVIRARRRRLGAGTWWEITPPSHTSPETMVAVWRTVAGLLHRRGWFGNRARIAFEAVGTDRGVRVGVWLPASLRSAGLAHVVQAAWPGATLVVAAQPAWPSRAVAAMELRPLGGAWSPLVHPAAAQPDRGRRQGSDGAEEPLRALFTALADRAPGELAAVQIIARPHPSYRGPVGPTGAVSEMVAAGLGACAGMVGELLDIFTPGPVRHSSRGGVSRAGSGVRPDAVQAAAVKAIDAKRIDVPHLAVTLRVVLATPESMPEQARRHRLALIRAGLDLVTVPLRARRLRHPDTALNTRRPSRRRAFVATTTELAALWHIPASPERYGLTLRPARTRQPGRMLPRIPTHHSPHHGGHRANRRGPGDRDRRASADGGPDAHR